jgi:hypothetical protein
MKLLVFAHTPPPVYALQSIVKLISDGAVEPGHDSRDPTDPLEPLLDCYHADCGQSEKMSDASRFQWKHVFWILRACGEAIWRRVRFDIRCFYYVPASGRRPALYRDWIVMSLCRPFFPHVIYHWQQHGLGEWLRHEGNWMERWLTHRLLNRPALSLSLDIPRMRDALWFESQRVCLASETHPDEQPPAQPTSPAVSGTARDSRLPTG